MVKFTKLRFSIYSILIGVLVFIFSTESNAQLTGYGFSQTNEIYTPITGGVVMAAASAATTAGTMDDSIIGIPAALIPFTFQFNYLPVTQVYVSANGFITFGTTAPAKNGSSTGHTPISAATTYDGAASAMGRNLNAYFISAGNANNGELRYQTIGVAPNRKFVVQYKNFRPQSLGTSFGQVFNFQIRLCETSNVVEIVYGTVTPTSANTVQVGLRGGTNGIFLNRTVATGGNWANSATGIFNTDFCQYSNTLFPASGLVYKFGTAACPAPYNLRATNVTLTTAELKWTVLSGGGTFNVEYGLSGFAVGTGTKVNNLVGTSLNISGLTSGSNYQFYVTQNCASSGNGISTLAGPKNFSAGTAGEDCSSAPIVSVASSLANCSYTVINSGVSQNGPLANCGDATSNLPDDDRWVKFVAPSNGTKLVITTTAGTINDWIMGVWSDCSGLVTSVVACEDDYNAFMPEISLCQNEYTPGQIYYLRMWTYSNSASGTMNLCIYQATECPIPPVNDNCALATRININPPNTCPATATTLTTKYATASGDASACGTASSIYDVWIVFNTGTFSDFNLNLTAGTATSLKASIFFECNGNEVQCFNNPIGSNIITGLNPGADYLIRIWSSNTTGWGTFGLCLSDICQEPVGTLTGSTIICAGDTAKVSVALSGGGPWTFTYSDGSTNTNVTTSVSPYVIDTAPAATTFYTLVSISNPTCSGTVSGNYLVNVVPKPVINNFTPASGPVGTQITMNGDNFTNMNAFGFNGVNIASYNVINNSQLTVVVPAGATSGLLSVKNLGCTVYSATPYTVSPSTLSISLKLFIEGFYSNGAMPAVLDPINKPLVCDSLELSLYLYSPTASPAFIMKAAAELSTLGNVSFTFPASVAGSYYYLAVQHRNSIETWSKYPVLVPSSGTFFNFSQP